MKTPKKHKTLGKMIQISAYKLAIAQGFQPHGMSAKKIKKIKQQVTKMRQQMDAVKRYTPFTSQSSKRKARQVGA